MTTTREARPWARKIAAALTTVAASLCAVVVAQEPALPSDAATGGPLTAGLEETIVVALHLVDVTVVDREGRPVTGLTADDFEVRVGGEVRPVRGFDAAPAVTGGAVGAQPGAAATAVPGHWIAIVFDVDGISPQYRDVARRTARAILETSRSPDDRFAVAALEGGALKIVQDFAPASVVDGAALDHAGSLVGKVDPLRSRLDTLSTLIESCSGKAEERACVLRSSQEFLTVLRTQNRDAIEALRALVRAMAPQPGRKALVLFSDGLVRRPHEVVHALARRFTRDADALLSRIEETRPDGYEDLMGEATRARVSVFSLRTGSDLSIDALGADRARTDRLGASPSDDAFKVAAQLGTESLRDVAEATGGRAVMTPLGEHVAAGLLQQLEGVYTLGVAARADDTPGQRVRVRLTRTKGRVQHPSRLGVRPTSATDLVASLAVDVPPPERFNGTVTVRLELSLHGLALEPSTEELPVPTSRIALYVRLLDVRGRPLADAYRILMLERSDPSADRYVHPWTFRLAPGGYVAQVFVADVAGRGGVSLSKAFSVVSPAE